MVAGVLWPAAQGPQCCSTSWGGSCTWLSSLVTSFWGRGWMEFRGNIIRARLPQWSMHWLGRHGNVAPLFFSLLAPVCVLEYIFFRGFICLICSCFKSWGLRGILALLGNCECLRMLEFPKARILLVSYRRLSPWLSLFLGSCLPQAIADHGWLGQNVCQNHACASPRVSAWVSLAGQPRATHPFEESTLSCKYPVKEVVLLYK